MPTSVDPAVPADPVRATEQWFVRRGLPYFVPSERAAVRAALQPRRTVPLLVATVLAALGVAVLVAWLSEDLTAAPATLTLVGVLAAVAYAVTALRARPIVTWAVTRTLSSLTLLLPMATRALPLLLVFVTFLFINAEVWQVAATLDGGVLWLTVLLFSVMGIGFFVVRLPEELDRVDHELDPGRIAVICEDTPLAAEASRLARDRGDDLVREAAVSGYERGNLVTALVVTQLVQVMLLSLSVFIFFLLFGVITMQDTVVSAWIGGPTHHVPGLENVSVELVQVSVFLAAFSGLYFTVYAVTDETYRDQFFTGVMAELERAVAVRAAYTLLNEERRVADADATVEMEPAPKRPTEGPPAP